ncbi:MAG: glycosyltransferase family A protein [Sphaerimonospora mesophila]
MNCEPVATSPEKDELQHFLLNALRIGVDAKNVLLLDYCREYASVHGLTLPQDFDDQYFFISHTNLRWLETSYLSNSDDGDLGLTEAEAVEQKIQKVADMIETSSRGGAYVCYVAVPALNEEETIGSLIESFQHQNVPYPVILLVGDNNSTDRTNEIVRDSGSNVLMVAKPGIGVVRQALLERIQKEAMDPNQTIIVQTDADCVASPDYITSVVQEFQRDPSIQVGVGPSIYSVPMENGETISISSGREYGELLGTSGLTACFRALNREPQDYLIQPPFRHLVGPNTTFRASLFLDSDIRYPVDGKWEMVDLSVKIQQCIGGPAISYINGQSMDVSPRAILGNNTRLTDTRLQELRSQGYVDVFKTGGASHSPLATIAMTLEEIDSELYDLQPGQIVLGIINEDAPVNGNFLRVPAIHAATKKQLVGRVALIGQPTL